MKNSIIKSFCFLVLFNIIAAPILAQCDRIAGKMDLAPLEEYDFCGDLRAALMYTSDSTEVDIKLQPRTKYIILIESQSYLGTPVLGVVNKDEKLLSFEVLSDDYRYWEV